MTDEKKDAPGESLLNPAVIASPGAINQFRQLSIPLGARIVAVVIAVLVLAGGSWLVFEGWRSCKENCNGNYLEHGTKILGAAILPALVVIYLAFAETGVKALTRKIGELLNETLPNALRQARVEDFVVAGELEECAVTWNFDQGSPRARYRLTARRNGESATLILLVDLNVAKANVVFFVPEPAHGDALAVRACFKEAMAGAVHEGYTFDESLSAATIDDRRYLRLVARKRLAQNFLWDPALKLHFAQDLRMFVHAMIVDGWDLLERA
jgi:hypothetical protein